MMQRIMLLGLTGLLLGASCKKDSNTVDREALNNPVSVYPAPPSKWMQQGSTPYYSSGFVGDAMPFFDNGKFHIFYLHDARDGQQGFHPIHKFVSDDLVHYNYEGLMVNYAGVNDQDLAIGTGSVVKVGNTYYCYYTGHNYLFPNTGLPKEGIMYATSTDLKTWTKKTGFNLLAPVGYDRNEFRDPQVFFNTEKNEYWMLVSARTGGKAVVALFTSANPATDTWTLKDPLFTTDEDSYFMLECADMFKWGNHWYLLFSENNAQKTTHYRIATSSTGPWTKPATDVIDGEYFYAAKTASDGTNRYAFGWTATKNGSGDANFKEWAGNLVVHQLKQQANGALSASLPVKVDGLFTQDIPLQKAASNGDVQQTGNSTTIKANGQPAGIIFNRINGQKKVATAISGIQAGDEWGLQFGVRERSSDYYRISFDQAAGHIASKRVSGSTTFTESRVPFNFQPGTEYQIKAVIDGSVCVVYVNDAVALSTRIYNLPNAGWGLYATKGNIAFNNTRLTGH